MAQGRAAIKHRVKLTADERQTLGALVRQGRSVGWKLQRAGALLKCDEGEAGPAWADAKIAQAFDVTSRSVESWRKQAVERGPLSLLKPGLGPPPATPRKWVSIGNSPPPTPATNSNDSIRIS